METSQVPCCWGTAKLGFIFKIKRVGRVGQTVFNDPIAPNASSSLPNSLRNAHRKLPRNTRHWVAQK